IYWRLKKVPELAPLAQKERTAFMRYACVVTHSPRGEIDVPEVLVLSRARREARSGPGDCVVRLPLIHPDAADYQELDSERVWAARPCCIAASCRSCWRAVLQVD